MMQQANRFVLILAIFFATACGGEKKVSPGSDADAGKAASGEDAAKVQPMTPDGEVVGIPPANPAANPAEAPTKSHDPKDYPDLKIEVLAAGAGEVLHYGGTGEFEYTGMTLDGVVFDSSLKRGGAGLSVLVDMERRGVIEGWILGLQEMKLGEERRLTIPSELGYGERGSPPNIPGNATLAFNVKLLKIVDAGKAQ